jgi:hypothetical protein
MSIDPSVFEPEEFADDDEHRERFRIDGPNTASWALRKLAQARGRIEENDGLADMEKQRVDDWRADANKPHERDVEYFESILRNWHEEQLDADPKRKTVSLPGGKLVAAKNPDSLNIENDLFMPWAIENKPEWVREKTTFEPEKAAIKKAGGVVAETGEIAPGVSVIPGDLRWKAVTE